MGDLTALKTQILDKTGYNPADNASFVTRCLNIAQREVTLVKFNFLWGYATQSIGSGQAPYDLPSGTGWETHHLDEVFIGTSQLRRGDKRSILLAPASDTGQPAKYIESGYNSSNGRRTIYFGGPTSDATYNVKIAYYRWLVDLGAATDVSAISQVWMDKPLVTYASYLIYNNLEQYEKAAQVLGEFRIDMKDMERLGFEGDSYEDILMSRELISKEENEA